MAERIDFDAELQVETATIVFADVVESVRLVEQDERANVSRIRAGLMRLADQVAPVHGGTVLERRGDGLLIKFVDVRRAAAFAVAAHGSFEGLNEGVTADNRIALRVGIHTADVLTDRQTLYGNGINIASRVTTLAEPGETVISADARDGLVDGLHADLQDRGECFVRNLAHPLRVYSLGPVADGRVPLPRSERVVGRAAPTLAVLPLRAGIASPAANVIGELIADNVVTRLSRTHALRVVSRLSTTAVGSSDMGTLEIASRLGADYLLSGSCREVSGRLVAFVELCDGKDGNIIWAEQLRTSMDDLLADECDFADHLASEVQLRIIDHQMTRLAERPLPTLQSYTLLLGGLSLMHRQSEREFNRARDLFEYLRERHPRNAVPRAWLGKWHMLKIVQGWTSDVGNDARMAVVEATRALEIEPHNSLCLTVKGVIQAYLQHDFEAAAVCFSEALNSNPNDALARLQQAALCGWSGDTAGARDHASEALRLSPLDPHLYFLHSLVAGALLGAGDFAQAEEHARRSIRANSMHVATYKVLVIAQAMQGKASEAAGTACKLLKHSPDFTVGQFAARSPWARHPDFASMRKVLRASGVPA